MSAAFGGARGRIRAQLDQIGLEMPLVPSLGISARRATVVVYGELAYISGTGPIGITGTLGKDLGVDAGYHAARVAALYCLRRIEDELGDLDRVSRWLKVVGYVRSTPEFAHHPLVVNGFSDLICDLYDEDGHAARTAIGVCSLPREMPVEVDAIVALR